MSSESVKLPVMARVGVVVAFVLVLVVLMSALKQPFWVLAAIIPLWTGIGILLRRAWSAYGFALLQLSSVIAISLLIKGSDHAVMLQLIGTAIASSVLAILFFFAGKALARSGAKNGSGKKGLVWPWVALALLQIVPLLFVRAFIVPTGSMENTILFGDHVLVREFPKPRVVDGDILVFKYPMDHNQTYIKRVIGVPGDHIHIKSRLVYRNGSKLVEPYAIHRDNDEFASRDNFPLSPDQAPVGIENGAEAVREMDEKYVSNGELVVPPGKYFVLGDNRDNSMDSRYWGLVDESEVIGKPILIYYSDDGHGKAIRWERLMKLL